MAKNLSSASVNFSQTAVSSTVAKTKAWMAVGYLNVSATIQGVTFRLGEIALTVGNEQHIGLFKGLTGAAGKQVLINVMKSIVIQYKANDSVGVDMSEFEGMDDFEAPVEKDSAKEKALGYINFSLPIAGGELAKLGGISLFASSINQARVNHVLSRPGDAGENNALLIKSRLTATAYPTALGRTLLGGAVAPVENKAFLALVV